VLLESKNAVIYGGGGSIGGAVARAFAREGASLFLAGRTEATLEEVADDIRAASGQVKTAVVDALDEEAVDPGLGFSLARFGWAGPPPDGQPLRSQPAVAHSTSRVERSGVDVASDADGE
jgi:NAD(P)-dependent dehydrogenase (short-subunit alcohol dehydrogenase family)